MTSSRDRSAASPAPRPIDVFHTVIGDLLGIKYPILQGAMQGGGGVELVASVSEAGGLGVLPTLGGGAATARACACAPPGRSASTSCPWAAASPSVARRPASSSASPSSPRGG